MKKLITILALLTNLCNAQTQSDYINVINVTDTLSTNDTLTIVFTKSTNFGGNGMSVLQLWTSSYLQDCLNVFSGFLSLDSANTYKHKVKITPIMGTGNGRIYSNKTIGNYKRFYIKPAVSVNEYDVNSSVIDIKYYDIYGKEKPSYNEGLTIRITTYSNGYQKRDKVIFQP
jgi:hypothetical protein